ncbi:MAG TPA: hypothetical protein VII72_08730 [Myxococcota bacterium]
MVWTSNGSSGGDASYSSTQAQRYASNGSTLGAQFQVNTYTTGLQYHTSVAADADGDFVVVWQSYSLATPTLRIIQGQRYASNGSTQGTEFQVSVYTTTSPWNPSVAADADGDFVVVWQEYLLPPPVHLVIFGRRYASNGSTLGAHFQVNSDTTRSSRDSSVAVDPAGNFVVVWRSSGSSETDTSSSSIQGQRYASNGSAQGAQFQVNTYTTNAQESPAVATGFDGDFVVAWQSNGSSGADSSSFSTQGQRYASDGSTQGAQFQVNTYTTNAQESPAVATGFDGDFVVAWQSNGSSGTDSSSFSTQGQRYASDGSTQGEEFQVNTYTTQSQQIPSVASGADGNFVVAWRSNGSPGTDTSGSSVQGQRYSVPATETAVPALSRATRFALAAVLLLLGARWSMRRRG